MPYRDREGKEESMSLPMWRPSEDHVRNSNMAAFINHINESYELDIADYDALYQYSITKPEQFWWSLLEYSNLVTEGNPSPVLLNGDQMPGATWFPELRLNFAENLLRYRDNHIAILFHSENGRRRSISYYELFDRVARLASRLRELGVEPGDRVAALLPNIPEAVIGMLATTSIGAIWSSCSPDFGVQGVMDRFGQIEPKILIAPDGYTYNGKEIDLLPEVQDIAGRLPSLLKVIVVPYLDPDPVLWSIPLACSWCEMQARGTIVPLPFTRFPFNHPVYIMYSSGTTGLPKSIVHGAGGTLLQHSKELALHTNITRNDVVFYYTTCGWMMWNWLVSTLSLGATVLLYEGSPMYPKSSVLWDMAEEEGVTVFGTSAKYIASIDKEKLNPSRTHKLLKLKAILSTGSPLAPESYDFVYSSIKKDVQLSSISGGTDIISCFALGNPVGPVWRGELQSRGLGMNVEVFDPDGNSIVGEKGELVCTKPFPSMPVQFWNDPDGSRYHAAYFERYANTWHHGDYAEITEHNGLIIYGRSDTVLNPGGVRIGTAEIYRVVESIDEVLESVCVGQEWNGDVRVLLFVRLREGKRLSNALKKRIRDKIRKAETPRHVPSIILEVEDIPRTISGKISESAVRETIHNRDVTNTDALANPESLAQFKDIPELQEG